MLYETGEMCDFFPPTRIPGYFIANLFIRVTAGLKPTVISLRFGFRCSIYVDTW